MRKNLASREDSERRALQETEDRTEPFRVKPHSFGFPPTVDLDKLNQLVDELEVFEFYDSPGGRMRLDSPSAEGYRETMRAVALKDLEARVAEYVHLAEGGETVLVTDDDRVIAQLVPPRDSRISPWESPALAEAIQKGWITPPTLPDRGAPPRFPVAPLSEILRELDEDRSDR